MSININNYPILESYTVLAASGITTVRSTDITGGVYGTPSGTGITGPLVGTSDNGAPATAAQIQLTTGLVAAINAKPVTSTISGGSGPIIYTPGRYNSASAISYGTGTQITLDAGGNPNAQFFFTAGSSFTFNNVSSITLAGGATNCNVFWLAGSAITFTGTSPSTGIPGIFIAYSKITFANDCQIYGRLYARTENVTFDGVSGTNSVDGNCTDDPGPGPGPGPDPDPVVCYAKGTLILTKKGFVPIENIKEGDKVVTKGKIYNNKSIKRDSKLEIESVMWISKFKVKSLNSKSRPICIKKDALGKNYPFQDLYVSPNHSLLLNGKMIPAKYIVNGDTIYQDKECDSVEYYHLECEEHSAIIANGVLSESYLDVENRDVFENSVKLGAKVNFKKIYYYSK